MIVMKRILSLVLVGIMILSLTNVFAEEQTGKLPDVLKAPNERYAEFIAEAIEKSTLREEEIDKDNIYIIESKDTLVFDGGADNNPYYVALPSLKTDDIYFTSFVNGKYVSEGMNTLSPLGKVETHRNTKIEEYINANNLENVKEAINVRFYVSSGANERRAKLNTYRVITSDDTYYIPYYMEGVFNPANDESCTLELYKAYTEDEIAQIMKTETRSYINYMEAKRKAEEEERIAKEATRYTPTFSLDENGNLSVTVCGVGLYDVMDELIENINIMESYSNIEMRVKTEEENYQSKYVCQKGRSVNEVIKFTEELFENITLQAESGKPDPIKNLAYCNFSLNHVVDFKTYHHNVEISVWDNGVRIQVGREEPLELKVNNGKGLIDYIDEYATKSAFSGFTYEKYDENTPRYIGNLQGLTKTDVIEFKFVTTYNMDGSFTKEVASVGTTVHGKFEKHKENKYRSVYILTLSGDLGAISLYYKYQTSLSAVDEHFTNSIPVFFPDKARFENEQMVQYVIGKSNGNHEFKMAFANGDISQVYFENIKCTDLKYTQLVEDEPPPEEDTEQDKEPENKPEEELIPEVAVKSANECADALYDAGLFKGTDNGYELEKTFTREESATILVRLVGEEKNINTKTFNETFIDVNKDRWSFNYVMYCYENDITKGTGSNTFSPDVQINAEQFVALLMRLLGYTEVNPDTALSSGVELNLLSADMVEHLENSNTFTRGDMVQIVYNSLYVSMANGKTLAQHLADKNILTQSQAEN